MKNKRKKFSSDNVKNTFVTSDGTNVTDDDYDVNEYLDFVSDGFADNEKVEAEEYYDRFLNRKPD